MKLAQTFTGAPETKILDPSPQGLDDPGCLGKGWLAPAAWLVTPPSLTSIPWRRQESSRSLPLGHLVTLPSVGDLASEG